LYGKAPESKKLRPVVRYDVVPGGHNLIRRHPCTLLGCLPDQFFLLFTQILRLVIANPNPQSEPLAHVRLYIKKYLFLPNK
jgi:hypothetical protein